MQVWLQILLENKISRCSPHKVIELQYKSEQKTMGCRIARSNDRYFATKKFETVK